MGRFMIRNADPHPRCGSPRTGVTITFLLTLRIITRIFQLGKSFPLWKILGNNIRKILWKFDVFNKYLKFSLLFQRITRMLHKYCKFRAWKCIFWLLELEAYSKNRVWKSCESFINFRETPVSYITWQIRMIFFTSKIERAIMFTMKSSLPDNFPG